MRIRALTIMAAVAICLPAISGARGPNSGALDPSFGRGGRVILHPSVSSSASAAVGQTDGKIVLAGHVHDGTGHGTLPNNDFLAVRLTRNGGLDRSFGLAGFVHTTIDLGRGNSVTSDVASALALSPDGSIVLAGTATDEYRSVLALARYTTSGSPDTSFADDGVKTIDPNPAGEEGLRDVAVQPDGKIVAVGSAGSAFLVVRLLPNGALDATFGSEGIVQTKLGGPLPDFASAVTILGDGRIVVAGSADLHVDLTPLSADVGVAQYLPNGRLDPAFGTGGVVVTPGPRVESGCGVAVTSGGKILVVGAASVYGYRYYNSSSDFHLVRYLPSGALDAGFGQGGVVSTSFPGAFAEACSAAVQRDGRILAGGSASRTMIEGSANFALARYTSSGRLDESFSGDGKRTYDIRVGKNDLAAALVLQRDAARSGADRLVLAGSSQTQPDWFADVSAVGIDLGAAQPLRCRVPNVVGSTLARAKARIRSAHCWVGRVRLARSIRPRGRVISQRPRAGKSLPRGSRVNLVVSRRR